MKLPRKMARSALTQAAVLAVVRQHPHARPAEIARHLEAAGYEADVSMVSRHVRRLARGRYLTADDGCTVTEAGDTETQRLRGLLAC